MSNDVSRKAAYDGYGGYVKGKEIRLTHFWITSVERLAVPAEVMA
jgi:hypothetical protein